MHPPTQLHTALTLLALAALSVPASAQTATFDFANDLPGGGKTTTFTNTSNGLSATFISPFDPFIFQVAPSILKNTPGNMLGPGQVGANFVPLDIVFSEPLQSISFNFGLNGFASSTLSLATFSGGAISAVAGTLSGTAGDSFGPVKGTIPGGIYLFPEGTV
jgi:hypothetical protein